MTCRNNARFLWKRMPEVVRGHAEVRAIWEIGQCIWKRDHPRFYAAASAVNWSPLVATLISPLVGVFSLFPPF